MVVGSTGVKNLGGGTDVAPGVVGAGVVLKGTGRVVVAGAGTLVYKLKNAIMIAVRA